MRALAVVAALLIVAGALGAHPVRAQVSGFVIDSTLARVPGARVSIQAGGPATVTDAAFALPAANGRFEARLP